MLKEIFESLDKTVFTAELRESLERQFNEAVEVQANALVEERIEEELDTLSEKSEAHIDLLNEKSNEHIKMLNEQSNNVDEHIEMLNEKSDEHIEMLNEKSDEHIKMLNEKSDEHIEMLNEKSDEHIEMLNEKSDEHIEFLNEKAEEYAEMKMDGMLNSVDMYLDKVVDEFVTEARESLAESSKSEKSDMIIEAFDTMLVATGVDIAKIVEAKDESAEAYKLDESINKYDELLDESAKLHEENRKLVKLGIITELKEGLTEKASNRFDKLAKIVEFTNDSAYLDKLEMIRENVLVGCPDESVDLAESNDRLESVILDLKEELSGLKEEVITINEEVSTINEEKEELIKLGVITELKEGLSIIQSEKFERLATQIDFVNDMSFVNKLEALKESVQLNRGSSNLFESEKPRRTERAKRAERVELDSSVAPWAHLV